MDVIEYLTQLESSSAPPLTPPGIFSRGIKDKEKRNVVGQIDPDKFSIMLKKKWKRFPDALTVNDIIEMTGYCQSAISDWIKKGKVTGVSYCSKYLIPKDCLIEYMATKANRDIHQKSGKHMELIRKCRKTRKVTEKVTGKK